ncbi:MAG: 6-phosphogluconolactonase [Gallionella sp.]|nr:6-phosphogluconolactonase [Gallionella sp.]
MKRNLPGAKAIVVHADAQALAAAAAQRIAELAAQAITARGVFHLALAGGETPRRCYEQLRVMPVDWRHVRIYFGDERCLPSGDAQRNDTMAREALLNHIVIPPENVHAIAAELGASGAAAEYAARLPSRLDLVLLGMGEDGHTASLFPGNPATESGENAVPVFGAPKPPPERVSLGMAVLNGAREKLFLVAGAGKCGALQRIARGEALPAARITGAEWHMDRAAWPQELI